MTTPATLDPSDSAPRSPTPARQVLAQLEQARRERRPVPVVAVEDEATAYQVQADLGRKLGWFGDALPTHWKSGARTPEGPYTHAPLPPAGVLASGDDASLLPFNSRTIEGEFALRLGRAVTPEQAQDLRSADVAGLEALIDGLCVSIEIVDSRWIDPASAPALSKLADLQSHGALVLGRWHPYARRDWSRQRCTVTIGDEAPRSFEGSLSVVSPLAVLAPWLRHATRHGDTVPAGTVVTTGTWCGMLPAAAGQRVTVAFEGFDSATVRL
jgi:2-keto-4-pentenoate hydratase